jgi:SAM-dependent methyltransferase
MSLIDSLALWWQSRKTRRKMDRVFSRGADPYHYAENAYELKRLSSMAAVLDGRRYRAGLEVGCAEGLFTERLAPRCESLIALDISEVALERARERLRRHSHVRFACADVRAWSAGDRKFDLIVLGDVLYYLDKPMVREQFEQAFPRLVSWLSPGGRLVLAHGFAGDQERAHREGFTRRFEALGLKRSAETVVSPDEPQNAVRCLLAVLDRGA